MLQTVHNSEFSRTMDLFKEIDDLSDLFLLEKNTKLDCPDEGYEDLQTKYSSLHENYAKEIENSKKVEKCLVKCLKFYSKLSKKYEVQQQIIRNLEESIKEKVNSLEEAQRNEEKMKGLIQVYRTERTLYAGQTSSQLRKEKEMLLDICCKLIGESVKTHNTRCMSSLLLRKFKKDLDEEKINLLKNKSIKFFKEEFEGEDLKPDFGILKNEFKSEDKCSSDLAKAETNPVSVFRNELDLSESKMTTEEISLLETEISQEDSDKSPFAETEQEEPRVVPSLPSLEDLPLLSEPTDNEEQHQDDVTIDKVNTQFDQVGNESLTLSSCVEREHSSIVDYSSENIIESDCSETLGASTFTTENHLNVRNEDKPEEPQTEPGKGSGSIFDICDPSLHVSDARAKNNRQENIAVETEYFSEVTFMSDVKSENLSCVNNTNKMNLDVTENEDDEVAFPYESELCTIFKEMSSIRLLSPIRQINSYSVDVKPCAKENKNDDFVNPVSLGVKRNGEKEDEENNFKNKKFKLEEEKSKCCLLDSIMSAMSIQNEEFKSKRFARKESVESGETSEGSSCEFANPRPRVYTRRTRRGNSKSEGVPAVVSQAPGRNKNGQQAIERLVTEEIKNFVSSSISCKDDADKNMKHCLSVLSKKSEDVIAKCIVSIVLENIDETVEVFERPAPPLTKTQHRLIVLLSVFRSLGWDCDKISTKILSIITEKLFPDNFFWPDDCVEAAARFYTALCRGRNDPKTLWKFCLNGMTDMKQRCPLLVFTVLRTWPDVLHDASTLKNNMLAVTIVNIFLHMPKTEGLRNENQKRKLAALKHLLINFYQFKVEDTIERYAKRVVEAICRDERGSEKSLVLLSKCRDQSWTSKNVVPELKTSLADWFGGKMEDSRANALLSVIKQICPVLMQENNNAGGKVKELALYLSDILTSGKKSHDSEVNLVEVLLLLKQYSEVRKAICEWVPKGTIKDSLRNDIINASAENILRELKLNRKKETKTFSTAKPKHWKKSKGKKKKGKKRKKNEQKAKAESTGVSSRN